MRGDCIACDALLIKEAKTKAELLPVKVYPDFFEDELNFVQPNSSGITNLLRFSVCPLRVPPQN